MLDSKVAAKLSDHFSDDLQHAQQVSLEKWEKRSAIERAFEAVGWFFERQQ